MMTPRLAALMFAILLSAGPVQAAETQVAVAANFTEPDKAIPRAFKTQTGHTATLSFGSSGQFYSQMAHGAPYDVLLSADADRPKKAEQDGLGVTGSRFTYAIGRLALYSKTPGLVDGAGAVRSGGRFNKLSIADPTAAAYCVSAVPTKQKRGVYG